MFGTIRSRLILFGVLSAALAVLLAVIGAFALRQLQDSMGQIERGGRQFRDFSEIARARDAVRSDVLLAYVAAKAGDAAALAGASQELAPRINALNDALKPVPDGDMAAPIAAARRDVATALKAFAESAKNMVAEFSSGAPPAAQKLQTFAEQHQKIERMLEALNNAAQSQVQTTVQESEQNVSWAIAGLAATALLAAVLSAAFGMALMRSVIAPMRALRSSIQQVRDSGDLTGMITLEGKDELAQLGLSVNSLMADMVDARVKAEAENDTLNYSVISIVQAVSQLSQRDLTARAPVTEDLVGTVSDSINLLTDETVKVLRGVALIAGQVQQVSGKVKAQADLVSNTAKEEREDVRGMVESLADATQVMQLVATLADQSNTATEQATQATSSALDAVNGTVKGMESIRETIAETEKRIKRLGERSQEITGIVNLINTISERTHVLALNASMQAAVAGEAGRGFAVVAEEVQRLAESSRSATQQIASLVGNIQIETNETINTVNRTITQVVQGSETAQKAGEQMRRTQDITTALVEQVRKITKSAEQQKEMSAQLLRGVQRIGQSTERTAEQIETQNRETARLLAAARDLVESVAVFKLPDEEAV